MKYAESGTMSRCFLGFELTDESRLELEHWFLPMFKEMHEELEWQIKMVLPLNWHATLLFFPELKPEDRELAWRQVVNWTEAKVWKVREFQWKGLAIWPSAVRPGLICLAGEPFKLSQQWPLASALSEFPFQAGRGEHVWSYRPHITLARFPRGRQRVNETSWLRFLSRHNPLPESQIQLDRLSFFLSKLSIQNPVYPRERTIHL